MKKLIIHLLPLALSATALCADSDGPPPPPEKSAMKTTQVILPLDATAPRPTIEAVINGQGPFLFILDTGAQGFVINADLARELDLPVIGTAAMGDPSDPQAIAVDRVRIESVDIGGVSLSGVVADSWDQPEAFKAHLKGRGVFGVQMLAAFLVTFDYPESQIVIENGTLAQIDSDDIIPWRAVDDGLHTVPLQIGDLSFDAHIDSGSPSQITLPENVRDKLAYIDEPVVVGRGRTVNSEFEVWAGTLDGTVNLGALSMEKPKLHFVPMLNSTGYANIGSSFLRDFVITFDHKSGLVRFRSG
ncbi:MAG: hypothetical protein GKR89_23465 [Candidatus Latescibacteria bacterium]|nr:hypothetical protein [Candidatus Latescibacterota bacterium]